MRKKLIQKLFEPPVSVKSGLPRLRARLLSGLTFGFLIVDILLTIRGELTGGASYQVYVFGALVLLVYFLSRTKYVEFGGIFLILSTSAMMLFFIVQAHQTSPERLPQGLGFITLPIFLALLLLPAKVTFGVAIINIFSLGIFIQQKNISIDSILLPLVSSLFFTVIILITAFILEKDRKNLVDANEQLRSAYEATLEGWAKALELKDKETERHSKDVVDYTIKIAEILGLTDEELTNIRRGAILHDIGKMAIPDKILHKPGKLTKEEWRIMMQHPIYAYNFLSSIDYLRPALDIPLYHHEKWDGTGYSKGLKEFEIPLSARIFSVVDVWEALNSDRPYRDAWKRDRIIQYITDQNGKHFDPEIVEIFLSDIITE